MSPSSRVAIGASAVAVIGGTVASTGAAHADQQPNQPAPAASEASIAGLYIAWTGVITAIGAVLSPIIRDVIAIFADKKAVRRARADAAEARVEVARVKAELLRLRDGIDANTGEIQAIKSAALPKVLIIEDDEDTCRITARTLLSNGFRPSYVGTVKDALAGLLDRPPLVIIDYNLPDGNGFDVMREIREVRKLNTKIILMTGTDQTRDSFLDGVARYRPDKVMLKPVDPEKLLSALRDQTQPKEMRTDSDIPIILPSNDPDAD